MQAVKYEWPCRPFYDGAALEAHWAQMAQAGWLLAGKGLLRWRYEAGMPKAYQYAAVYVPRPQEAYQQWQLRQWRQAGWWELTHWGGMWIFCAEPDKPRPHLAQESEVLADIAGCMVRRILIEAALMCLALARLAGLCRGFWHDPIGQLSDGAAVAKAAVLLIVALVMLSRLLAYARWHKGSQRAIAAGGGRLYAGSTGRRLSVILLAIALVWFLGAVAWAQGAKDAPPPLDIQALLGIDCNASYDCFRQSSPLLSYLRFHQYEAAADGSAVQLVYEVVIVRVPLLRDLCLDALTKTGDYQIAAAEPWQADVCYSNMLNDVICWDNRLVKLRYSWVLTDKQQAIMIKRLSGRL